MGDLHLNAGTAWNQGSLLHEGTHHAQRIVEGTVSLLEEEPVGAAQQN